MHNDYKKNIVNQNISTIPIIKFYKIVFLRY